MAIKKPHQIISPSNTLRAKVGADPAAFHNQAVESANQALEELKGEFTEWINKDLKTLKSARNTVAKNPSCPQSIEELRTRAHDLKGLGTTYGFPMASRLAASLCKLIEGLEVNDAEPIPMALVDSHINAILAVVNEDITAQDDKSTSAVAKSLEQMTEKLITGSS